MIRTYIKLYDLLVGRERQRVFLLLGMMIVMALADMVGVASILPFLSAVMDPGLITRNGILSFFYTRLGFTSHGSFLVFLGVAVLALIVISLAVKLLTLHAIARFTHNRNHSISSRLLSAYLRQPYSWFLNRNSAVLGKTVLNETDRVVIEGLLPALRLIAHMVSILLLIGLLVAVNPIIAMSTAALLGGTYALIFFGVRGLIGRLGQSRYEANTHRFRIAQEATAGIKEIKVMGLEKVYSDRYSEASRKLARSASTSHSVGELPRHLLETIAFGSIVLLILGLLLTGDGNLTEVVPTLGVFAIAGLKMFPAMQQIYVSLTIMRLVRPMLDNLHADVMATRGLPEEGSPGASAPLGLNDRIELAGVSYAYPETSRSALDGLDLTIPARTTVGIVGGSGAGKTTAVDVILGLLEPQGGALMVDGVTVGRDLIRAWQKSIGYVPQQIYLVDASIAENIAFGLPPGQIDHAAVERAARMANLHDFVEAELPKGYATEVGERGVRLSGGQRQRIGIARALYHDPDVLIFDEATSALDNLTERAVMEAVQKLGHRKTIVMIAHRLTTVEGCDCIFLLEKGRVVAQGTYESLVSRNEDFRRMARG